MFTATGGLSLKDKSANDDSEGYPTDEEWKLMEDKDKLAYLHDWLLELYLNIKFQGFDKVRISFTLIRPKSLSTVRELTKNSTDLKPPPRYLCLNSLKLR